MGEFIGRWVLVGFFSVACLSFAGAAGSGWGAWVLSAVWIGFWNAALRPAVLRMGFTGAKIYWALALFLLVLNGALFLGGSTWLPLVALPERRRLLWTALGVGAVSCALSSRFRSEDGRWHWITYHGSIKG
jgi:uncharacterized membrane protein YvlD (DUF360 family)